MSINLTGQRFGLLVALRLDDAERKETKKLRYWICKCDCGNTKSITTSSLSTGKTHSCGCRQGIHTHGMSHTRQYRIWKGMHERCRNKNNSSFYLYGERGITVTPKWSTFEVFWNDMQEEYRDDLTLDRIEVNGNYEKSNCRWATQEEQQKNKRNTVYYLIDGEKMCQMDIAKKFNISRGNICNRIRLGWGIEEIVKIPVGKIGEHNVRHKN